MPYVIGVDTGGTFTDGFVADHLGRLSSAKSPSTPPEFSVGVLTVIDDLAKSLGATTREFLRDTSYIVHGTTSTLNALITGDVCKVGFLTTKGHADLISIMNAEGRYAGLDPDQIQNMSRTNKPPALVPRSLIFEINERIDYKGAEIVRLAEDGVRSATRRLISQGVEQLPCPFFGRSAIRHTNYVHARSSPKKLRRFMWRFRATSVPASANSRGARRLL